MGGREAVAQNRLLDTGARPLSRDVTAAQNVVTLDLYKKQSKKDSQAHRNEPAPTCWVTIQRLDPHWGAAAAAQEHLVDSRKEIA